MLLELYNTKENINNNEKKWKIRNIFNNYETLLQEKFNSLEKSLNYFSKRR